MRTMMLASVPVDIGNATIKDGTLAATVQETLERVKAESAYFYTDEQGRRCCTVVFDLDDSSQIPVIAEPLFQRLSATVRFQPVMNADELQKGIEALAR